MSGVHSNSHTPRRRYSNYCIPQKRGKTDHGENDMTVQVFIARSQGGFIEVSVVKEGLSSGPGHKYDAVKARSVLLAFGCDSRFVDRQLECLSRMPPNILLKFPAAEISDAILTSLGFAAAAFTTA
jgi:hypothetical protein